LSVKFALNNVARLSREGMAARVARDIEEGWYVNLGIGVPTKVADQIPPEREVVFHSENGVLGLGPAPAPGQEDRWLINAGKDPVTLRRGASLFNNADSFAMVRGGHVDLGVLGAYQVAVNGDFANWATDLASAPAVGGAMDIAVGARRIWVMMDVLTKDGKPRLVERCSYPLTAPGVVVRVYTNVGTFVPAGDCFEVLDLVDGVAIDDLRRLVAAPLRES
jgi:3-oxoadipate CoA-transferase, beta subunit